MKTVEINNKKIFWLIPVNQLLTEGLEQQKMFFTFHEAWPTYAKKAINLHFERAVENLTCAMLLGEEAAFVPLAKLYYSGTIYGILPNLTLGDYIILLGKKLKYKSCENLSLRTITDTKYLEEQTDELAITIICNTLYYYRNFRFIGDEIKKKIIRDCNNLFEEEWHFCKFNYSYSALIPFEIEEEVSLISPDSF